MELQKSSDTSKRGWIITPSILEKLKNVFNLNANASNAGNACGTLDEIPIKPESDKAFRAFEALSVYKNQRNDIPSIDHVTESEFEVF